MTSHSTNHTLVDVEKCTYIYQLQQRPRGKIPNHHKGMQTCGVFPNPGSTGLEKLEKNSQFQRSSTPDTHRVFRVNTMISSHSKLTVKKLVIRDVVVTCQVSKHTQSVSGFRQCQNTRFPAAKTLAVVTQVIHFHSVMLSLFLKINIF